MSTGFDWSNADAVIDVLCRASATLRSTPGRSGCTVHLPERGTLLIAGDLHDHLPNYQRIIAAAGLDEPDHHLLLQELIHGPTLLHGCDMSWRMLVRTAQLVNSHPGRVHPLLGNHENSQLTGVGVTKGGGNSVELFEDGLAMSFGESWEQVGVAIDGFLRSMPLVVRTESGVQCSHSLPDAVLMNRFDPGVLDRQLEEADRCGPDGGAYLLTWGRRFTDAQIDELRAAWGVSCFVIGHVQIDRGVRRMGPHVLALASDQDAGAVLPLDLSCPPDVDALMSSVRPIQTLPAREIAG
ncbi:MAG: hypothetical protein QF733_05430 [Phycisphaerales bacterium]|jgi:hypothetical protein|nr:hypothetical protein [Phycisphaerales bacterium]